jgi:hypothetical protein
MLTLEAERRGINDLLLLLPLGQGGSLGGWRRKRRRGTRRGREGLEEGTRTRWGTRGGLQLAESPDAFYLSGHSEVIVEQPLVA